ncbi:MAG: ABC transporter permease [Clostridiales bacterium]|nr:ABC transporter permease [Clostridiales bacterium]
MFINALKMAKSTWKLIIRSKGFIVFGLVLPILATLFINLWFRTPTVESTESVYELSSIDEQIVYQVDFNRYTVKVYDTVMNDRTDNICNNLNSAGMFQIYRADATALTDEEIRENYEKTAMNERIGAVVVLRENEEDTELFSVGDDERFDMFRDSLETALANDGKTHDAPDITFVSGEGDEVDYYETRNFSYCLAFASLSFVFGGVLILSTVLSEKKDKVFSRLMLTKATKAGYLLSKIILSASLSLFQTVIMTLCFLFLVKVDIGITALQFFLVLFLIGMVFNLMSLCIGLYFNSLVSASVASFVIWSTSALLAGTYFDISQATELYKKVALLMPQRWALFAVSRFMGGDSSGYSLILCVSAAYLVIIFVVGVLGLRLQEEE